MIIWWVLTSYSNKIFVFSTNQGHIVLLWLNSFIGFNIYLLITLSYDNDKVYFNKSFIFAKFIYLKLIFGNSVDVTDDWLVFIGYCFPVIIFIYFKKLLSSKYFIVSNTSLLLPFLRK